MFLIINVSGIMTLFLTKIVVNITELDIHRDQLIIHNSNLNKKVKNEQMNVYIIYRLRIIRVSDNKLNNCVWMF